MKKDLGQVKETINNNMDFLKNTYHIKDIGVFGSVARRDNTVSSDIDILVEFSRPIGFFKFIEMEEHLGKLLSRKVDLVTKRALKPIIREEVLQEVIYV